MEGFKPKKKKKNWNKLRTQNIAGLHALHVSSSLNARS